MLMALLLQAMPAVTMPPSLKREVLQACAPKTLLNAEECLRASVSQTDLVILLDRIPARRFRPNLDCELEAAWHLADPASPMGRIMDDLLGVHNAPLAAGMIISDLQSRASGGGLPFAEIKAGFKTNPPPPDNGSAICAALAKPAN